jgi:hypothetical protein
MSRRTTVPTRARKSARSGAYGSKPFEAGDENAAELLRAIEQELGDADFFTREDLLQCNVFGWCATITRYRYIGDAVSRLIYAGRLVRPSATELALPNRAGAYRSPDMLADEFGATIRKLAHNVLRRTSGLDVSAVLAAWKTDEHLPQHVRRVTVRRTLARMKQDGEIVRLSPGLFGAKGAAHVQG